MKFDYIDENSDLNGYPVYVTWKEFAKMSVYKADLNWYKSNKKCSK